MQSDPYALDPRLARRHFAKAVCHYDDHAFLQREVGSRLVERLDYIRLQPQVVLDLGCGTGWLAQQVAQRYPQAHMVAVDAVQPMVQQACRALGQVGVQGICADAHALPLADGAVDMVLSNLMLQWCAAVPQVFAEVARVLRAGGLWLFTTFGPDTLKELRASWAQVDGHPHVSQFWDMHDLGDALLAAGLRDPVVDMEMLTLTYPDVRGLLAELKGIGANNAALGQRRGLTGKGRWQAFWQAYGAFRLPDGRYPATYEVIYGHAWAPPVQPAALPQRFIPLQAV